MLGRRRPLYVGLRLLQGPVSFVNSRPGLFSAASTSLDVKAGRVTFRESNHPSAVTIPALALETAEVALFPKLRARFAEFLGEGSPDHLRTLILADRCRFAVRTIAVRAAGLFLAGEQPWRGISSAA